jgi:hypothetical protein
MMSVESLAPRLQRIFGPVAEVAARESGCLRRQRVFTGASLCQSLVFGWLAAPHATLDGLCHAAALCQAPVTPQGLDQRFTPALADCLRRVLAEAILEVVSGTPVAIPVLHRFPAVVVLDSSVLRLPDILKTVWQGCGGRLLSGAALKLSVRLDLAQGTLDGPILTGGRVHDRTAAKAHTPLPAGALEIADLGYFSLERFATLTAQGAHYLSRLRADTSLVDPTGTVWQPHALLEAQGTPVVDLAVRLGRSRRVPSRLIAVRVPQEVANERRRKLRYAAKREGRTPRQATLALAAWTVFVTDLPTEQLSVHEALALGRARWQIELLFKLWKTEGALRTSRGHHPDRVHCEILAKLLALLVQHWLLITTSWHIPDRSVTKAAQAIRHLALPLVATLHSRTQCTRILALIARSVQAGCHINRRKTKPNTYQRLLAPALGALS